MTKVVSYALYKGKLLPREDVLRLEMEAREAKGQAVETPVEKTDEEIMRELEAEAAAEKVAEKPKRKSKSKKTESEASDFSVDGK